MWRGKLKDGLTYALCLLAWTSSLVPELMPFPAANSLLQVRINDIIDQFA